MLATKIKFIIGELGIFCLFFFVLDILKPTGILFVQLCAKQEAAKLLTWSKLFELMELWESKHFLLTQNLFVTWGRLLAVSFSPMDLWKWAFSSCTPLTASLDSTFPAWTGGGSWGFMILKKESVLFVLFVHFRPDLQRLQTFRGWKKTSFTNIWHFTMWLFRNTNTLRTIWFDPPDFCRTTKPCEEFAVPPGDVQPCKRAGRLLLV